LAESELGVLTSQCLDRRIPNKQILIDEIAAWEHDRNANHTKGPTGNSPPKMLASNLSIYTLQSE
jgi:hypothetical protein